MAFQWGFESVLSRTIRCGETRPVHTETQVVEKGNFSRPPDWNWQFASVSKLKIKVNLKVASLARMPIANSGYVILVAFD
jgi:hypothetical protein